MKPSVMKPMYCQKVFCQKSIKSSGRHQGGFTLIELMMTVILGGIIMTVAVPSFQAVIKGNRLVAETNKLVADFNLARSEAIKRGVNLVICSTSNPNAATPSCSNSTNWANGWVVFADTNGNNTVDAGEALRVGIAQTASSAITVVSTNNTLTYTSEGLTTSAATMVVAICDERGANFGRQVQINPTGRPRLYKTTPIPSCTAPSAA